KPFDLKFTSTDGRGIDFEKLRGKVVLIDFWASWCGPCRRAFPEIKETYAQLTANGFEVIGVNLDEKEDAMRKVLTEFDMKYPTRFDGQGMNGTMGQRFGITGIPSMWLVDKKGVVRDIREGVPRDPTVGMKLKEQVTSLLEEKN
ncbi:MAG TPA: TlpA disulfide reductase family protein, partial [Candidatus Acidoferrum sp.]|nr:TlpA disulfide reductase family protein [Candidatus Acidoferrum sp.]